MTRKLFILVGLVLGGIHASAQTGQANPAPITFAPAVNYPAGDWGATVFCADLDGDSDLDLAVANHHGDNVSILKNNGDGTFQPKVDYDAGSYPHTVFCADLDGDSDLDLAVTNTVSDNVSIFSNNGDGTFEGMVCYSVGDMPNTVFCADLDGDLDLDLAVSNRGSDDVSILKNNGDGTFQPKVDYPAGDYPYSVFCADLDGDLDLDLAWVNANSDNVCTFFNNGDGTFGGMVCYPVGDIPHSVFCADLDGDSDLDLAVANHYWHNVSVLKNNGNGTFQPKVDYGAGGYPVCVSCADLDGDSDLDMAVTNRHSDCVSILSNNGDGIFELDGSHGVGDYPHSVFCADLDGDSYLDLAVANFYGDSVSILLNSSLIIGVICGTVTHDNGDPVANVTVKVIDSNNNQVGDPVITSSDGSFYFDSLLVGTYSVMIVTPLGYSVSPSETQTGIEVTGYPCTEVNFTFSPTITMNNCRTIGYWKHQFDVHLSGRGHAQEDSSSLENYLDLVHLHFNVLGVYIDLENYDFEDAKNVLTVKGGRLMEDRAKQQLFALLLNFASGRIGNETVISEDDRVAAEAVTHVASLLSDGDSENDELAKTICDLINNGQVIQSDIIPASPERYKVTTTGGVPSGYSLEQNNPNPFNPICEISYALPTDCHVTLTIYNILGQKVRVLVDECQSAGVKSVTWDGRDDQVQEVTSGVYFYRIQAGGFLLSKKMVLMK